MKLAIAIASLTLTVAACGSSREPAATADSGRAPTDAGRSDGSRRCASDPDCAGAAGACLRSTCNLTTGMCVAGGARPEGVACDDEDPCTTGDSCTRGTCVGTALDCSSLDGECVTGTCDPTTVTCVAVDDANGTMCDDGDPCTEGDLCQARRCVSGAATDCSALTDTCNVGECNSGAGGCMATPLPNGTTCEDGNLCTIGDVCTAGICGATPRDCSAMADTCNTAACDPATGRCTRTPVTNGTTCSDSNACTTGDVCAAGTCTGTMTNCGTLTDQCNMGTCNPSVGCVAMPIRDGMGCTDGDLCTTGDACLAGTCVASPVDCSAMADNCNSAACDPMTGTCARSPLMDGTGCSDANACTTADSCMGGTCTGGAAPDCSGLTDQCNTGSCDTVAGCVAVPRPDGRACNDGDACTPVDTCTAGICGGASTCCGPQDFRIIEYSGYDPDYIEIQNRGTCTLNANTLALRFRGSCDSFTRSFTFPSRLVPPGGMLRVIETTTLRTNELYMGTSSFCHTTRNPGWVALCQGTCNATTCTNFLDYMEQNSTTVRPTTAPACATFTPSPVQVGSATTTQTVNRIAYVGSGRAGVRSDWRLATFTR